MAANPGINLFYKEESYTTLVYKSSGELTYFSDVPVPTKEGYIFLGWMMKLNGISGGTIIYFKDGTNISSSYCVGVLLELDKIDRITAGDGDNRLYAVWAPIPIPKVIIHGSVTTKKAIKTITPNK